MREGEEDVESLQICHSEGVEKGGKFTLSFSQHSFERKGEKGGREEGKGIEIEHKHMNVKAGERTGKGDNAE